MTNLQSAQRPAASLPQVSPELAAAVSEITGRPVFAGAHFGIAAYDVAEARPVCQYRADELFVGASTTKILTCAYALGLLGPDFRFRTRIVRNGRLDEEGTLHGDLVCVASGDPNLSGRVTPNDTLDFQHLDHSNCRPNARPVERNPLQIIEKFAHDIRAAGIRRVTGTVLIDGHLFEEGFREQGSYTTVAPICVNDNLIDFEITAGQQAGDRLSYRVSPSSGYVRFIDRASTGERESEPELRFSNEQREADGAWSVVISGTVPAGSTTRSVFPVQSPSRFARTLLVEALAAAGVVVEGGLLGPSLTAKPTPPEAHAVAEHLSPPLIEVTKVVLKVSQNLHAEMLIRVIGATLRGARGEESMPAGYVCGAELLARWGVDLTGAFQADAAGGYGYFSPDFMCRLLVRISTSDVHDAFLFGLPVMGRDGTLWDIQPHSPAAGRVAAKTGTIDAHDRLRQTVLYVCKGLAGYMTARSGRRIAFTLYLNNFQFARSSDVNPGQVLGELATAIHQHL